MMWPKWPRLVVRGEPVAKDLAAEIIVRTSGLRFWSNDKGLQRRCYKAVGLASKELDSIGYPDWQAEARVKKELGVLELEFLNNAMVTSSYVDGPHGWIDWEGMVGCSGFSIGKWPDHESVLSEWRLIASTWPELVLTCQLQDDETGLYVEPLAQYQVADGAVAVEEPQGTLTSEATGTHGIGVAGLLFQPAAVCESGCSEAELRRAAALCRSKVDHG